MHITSHNMFVCYVHWPKTEPSYHFSSLPQESLCKIDRHLAIWVIITLETGKDRFDWILFKVRFVSFSPPEKKHYPLACARHE